MVLLHYRWHCRACGGVVFFVCKSKGLLVDAAEPNSVGSCGSRTHQTALGPAPSRTQDFNFSFLFSYLFSYGKEKINWWEFFYIVQKLGGDNVFLFEVRLNFLIKAWLFFPFKNTFKKNWKFFIFFLYFKLRFFFPLDFFHFLLCNFFYTVKRK
jgi:hypothetical protein